MYFWLVKIGKERCNSSFNYRVWGKKMGSGKDNLYTEADLCLTKPLVGLLVLLCFAVLLLSSQDHVSPPILGVDLLFL